MKLRTTLTATATIVALACLLAGCNRDDAESTAGAGKKTLGVTLPNLTNPYYVAMKKALRIMLLLRG